MAAGPPIRPWEFALAGWLTGHRRPILVACAAITIVAAFFAVRLRFDSSIEIWFVEDDQSVVAYHAFLDRFEADELTVLGVFVPDVFTPDGLATLDRVTRAAEAAPHAHRVLSLTNLRAAVAEDDGSVAIGPLVERFPVSVDQAGRIRRRVTQSPLIRESFVSKDATAAAVLVELDGENADFDGKIAQVNAFREIIRSEAERGVTVLMAGTPVFDDAFLRYSKRDVLVFGPVTFAIVLIVCFIVFRRLSATLIPLVTIGTSTIWILGLMGALGMRVNTLSSTLVLLVMAVGVADSIHLLAEYYQELMKGNSPEEAVRGAVAGLLVPCFFTSATTAAGMLSLMSSQVGPVREFGWLAACAVGFAFGISVTLVPAILRFARPPDPAFIRRQQHGPLSRLLVWLGRPTRRRSVATLAITILVIAGGIAMLPRLVIGSNPLGYFHAGDPVRTHIARIDKALGGTASLELIATAPDQGLKDPEILRRLDGLERTLERTFDLTQAVSIVDSLKETRRVLEGGDPSAYAVPDSRALAAQLYLLLEGEDDFDAMVQDNYTVGRITARFNLSESDDALNAVPVIERQLAAEFSGPELRVEATGFLKLISKLELYLLHSLIRSLSIAFAVVSLIMLLLLRSVRLALLALIPNGAPILLGLAFMAAAGIKLDPGTVMVASIALGLVVDDTVHFLVRLRRHTSAGAGLEDAVAASMTDTGRPIVVTSVVLAAAFCVLGLGKFVPTVNFGLASAMIVSLALVADLMVLPAALMILRPRI